MSGSGTEEEHAALLTAGVVAVGIGVFIATMPAGQVLGTIVGISGVILTLVMIRINWRTWRQLGPRERHARSKDPDRFWNAEVRLKSAINVSAVFAVLPAVISLVNSSDNRWGNALVFTVILAIVSVSYWLVRRRNRRRDARKTTEH